MSDMVVSRWIIVHLPGQAPFKKSPSSDSHATAMLRELYALHPEAVLTLCELAYNRDLWVSDGTERLAVDDILQEANA